MAKKFLKSDVPATPGFDWWAAYAVRLAHSLLTYRSAEYGGPFSILLNARHQVSGVTLFPVQEVKILDGVSAFVGH